MPPLIVAVTGASGAAYATRLVEVLLQAGRDVALTISDTGAEVLKRELGLDIDLVDFRAASVKVNSGQRLRYYHFTDLTAPPASGSFLTAGMVVCPCSGGTLSAIAHGASLNLIHRAAEVHLKERRPLILVPRETPLSIVHLENMLAAARAGATILPAAPAFYHGVKSPGDLVDFIVARICDQLGVPQRLIARWGAQAEGIGD